MNFEGMETGAVTPSAMMTPVYSYAPQGQLGYGVQGQAVQGQGMGYPGFQGVMMGQRGAGGMQGAGFAVQGPESGGGQGQGMYPPTMHPTAMDYVPGGGFVTRVASPVPPGTTVTELDHL